MTPNDPYLPKLHELLTSQKNLRCRLLATLSRPTLEDLDVSVAKWFGISGTLKDANRTKGGANTTYLARLCFIHLAVAEFYYVQRQVAEYLQMHIRSMDKPLRVVKAWLSDPEFADRMWKFKQQVKKRL